MASGDIISHYSKRAEKWLTETTAVSILHVFPEACNLVNQKGEVLSLVDRRVGPGPFSLVLDGGRPFTDWINAETKFVVEDGQLVADGALLDMQFAELFTARPDWHLLREEPSRLARFLPLIRDLLAGHNLPETAVSAAVDEKLAQAGGLIKRGLAGEEMTAWKEAARLLAGLGQGLTPTGDDFLMGVMYGLWATREEEIVLPVAGVMAETAVPRTTTLSAAWLRAAAAGAAGWPWHELVDSLVVGWRQGVIDAVRWILATGHSSGADALRGFTAVLK